jgi:hypothetical protein
MSDVCDPFAVVLVLIGVAFIASDFVINRLRHSHPLMLEPFDFFIVWTKTGWAPHQAHETFGAAEHEAKQLARQHPGKNFLVLKAVAKYAAAPKSTHPGEHP